MSFNNREIPVSNELPSGLYDGKAEFFPALLRVLKSSLMAFRIPTERPRCRAPQFYAILEAQGLPIDPLTLSREDHKELIVFEKELAQLNAKGNQAIVCMTHLLNAGVLHKIRHILDDVTLDHDPWLRYERAMAFLAADIAGDTENTIHRIQVKIDHLQPVAKWDQLQPAWTLYDTYVRQQTDLGSPTSAEATKMMFHRLTSFSEDFRGLRDAIGTTYRHDTYPQWKQLALSFIRRHELDEITVKRYKTDHLPAQVHFTEASFAHSQEGLSPYSATTMSAHSTAQLTAQIPRTRIQISECWNCRKPDHTGPECTALYCRCCAIKHLVCQWDSITSPEFHRHYQCNHCRPQFRIPIPPTTPGPFPNPYANRKRDHKSFIQPYVEPAHDQRITHKPNDADNDIDDEEFEDRMHVNID